MTQNPARPPGVFDQAFLTGVEDVTEVLLVRHGEQHVPDYANGPVGDQFDPPLSERGLHQAKLVGERFSAEHVDRVYASPLQRALNTGREIARHHRIEPIIVDDLREVEIFRDIPREKTVREALGESLLLGIRERMLHEKSWDVYPLSESSFEFRRRVVNAIEGIIAENPGHRIVIACHGGVINAYVAHIIGARYDMFFRPAHASVSVVAAGHGMRAVHMLNDTHHLSAAGGHFVSH